MHDRTTRDQIVDAADRLFYRQGYEHTSFSDIAAQVSISRDNFYYHFKSKDEILEAVIAARLEHTQAMLARWEAEAETPAGRLRCFIHMLIANRDPIMRHGCPVGTLATELAKLNHAARPGANRLFILFRGWLARQFAALGHGRSEADALALHLLALSQGAATLANAFGEETIIRREVRRMEEWLDQVARPAARRRRAP